MNLIENFKNNFEDKNKFLNGNLNILVEENKGKFIKLNNENINIYLKLKNKEKNNNKENNNNILSIKQIKIKNL